MDFYVYDNIMTFNKLKPDNDIRPTRFKISRIEIPTNNSFWFFTDMQLQVNNVNLHKPYIHIHPGIGSTNEFKFDKNTLKVTRSNLVYNPKTKRVEVKNSILPWKKPDFMKKVRYYGSKHPEKKMSVLGTWYYHFPSNSVHFILDYFPVKINYHWEEDEGEEMATVQQYAKVNDLEEKIAHKEKLINLMQRTDPLFDRV
jgi:hypothetical protein